MSFAADHAISLDKLGATYHRVRQLTGETNAALELLFVGLG